MSKKAIVLTYDGSAHFFKDKEPADFAQVLQRDKFLMLPSGSMIATASVKGVYTHEDYRTLHETADRHKRHEWLDRDGRWKDAKGLDVGKADMGRLIQEGRSKLAKQKSIGGGYQHLTEGAKT